MAMAMAEAAFSAGSRFRTRDSSPESVVFTLESNYSVFSSTSASVERCSFASDAHDYDCRNSDISLHLEGNIEECKEENSGPDSDPKAINPSVGREHSGLPGKREKVKVEKENSYTDAAMDGFQPLDMARNSFSLALKECRDRRTRSEALLNKVGRQRAASLEDLNNVSASSPRLAIMTKSSFSPITSDTSMLQSPATTSCRPANAEIQKGWSSERVPLQKTYSSKQVTAAFLPFNNGRTLPSKWEDAERWIFSPVLKDGVARSAVPPPQRRPKSKSGPIGFPGIAYSSLYSPGMPMLERSKEVNFVSSPFSAGMVEADGLAVHSSGHEADNPVQNLPCIARSVSVHGCSQMRSESSLTTSVAQKSYVVNNSATNISRDVSRRDMATQMSPVDDLKSSLEIRPPISIATSSVQPVWELKSLSCSKLEVKDVEVDERVTLTRWSKRHKSRIPCKGQVHDKDAEPVICGLDVSDTTRSISKVMREEAKITAWENLQKAKAEAAIRKLEMKLEKKRSSSMDKIIKKLKSAQKKALEMRNSVLANQMSQVDGSSQGVISSGRICQRTSLSGCFTCRAF